MESQPNNQTEIVATGQEKKTVPLRDVLPSKSFKTEDRRQYILSGDDLDEMREVGASDDTAEEKVDFEVRDQRSNVQGIEGADLDTLRSVASKGRESVVEEAEKNEQTLEQTDTPLESKETNGWKEVRESYREHKARVEEAQERFMEASRAYEDDKHNAGFLGRFLDKSALDEKKAEMLEAQKEYDGLLDDLRNKRQERMSVLLWTRLKEKEKNDERRKRYVARHEALLERYVDNEVQLLEALRFNENETGESRNKYLRTMQKGWNWYKGLPKSKRLAVAGASGALVGGMLGAAGLMAGGAVVAGGALAARRVAGGFFGSIVALEAKRFGDKKAEAYGEKKLKEAHETFDQKELSKSRKERLGIKKGVSLRKKFATAGAVGSAVAVGAGTAGAVGSIADSLGAVDTPTGSIDTAVSDNTIKSTQAQEVPKRSIISSKIQELKAESAKMGALELEFAEQMGLDTNDLKTARVNGIPTEINGQKVPEELYTQEQLKRIRLARSADSWQEGSSGKEPITTSSHLVVEDSPRQSDGLESVRVDTRVYADAPSTEVIETAPHSTIEGSTEGDIEEGSEGVEDKKNETKEEVTPIVELEESALPSHQGNMTAPTAPHGGLESQRYDTRALYGPSVEKESVTAFSDEKLVKEESVLPDQQPTKTTPSVGLEDEITATPDTGTEEETIAEEVHIEAKEEVQEQSMTHEDDISAILERSGLMEDEVQKELTEEIAPPTELKVEGVYKKGSSVEKELRLFIENDTWVKEEYPDLTSKEKGAVAHRIRLELEKHPEMAEKLNIRGGDWDKVLKEEKYSFYIDRDLVEQEIEAIRPSEDVVDAVVERETEAIRPSEEIVDTVVEKESEAGWKTSIKSVAEELLDELRKAKEAGLKEALQSAPKSEEIPDVDGRESVEDMSPDTEAVEEVATEDVSHEVEEEVTQEPEVATHSPEERQSDSVVETEEGDVPYEDKEEQAFEESTEAPPTTLESKESLKTQSIAISEEPEAPSSSEEEVKSEEIAEEVLPDTEALKEATTQEKPKETPLGVKETVLAGDMQRDGASTEHAPQEQGAEKEPGLEEDMAHAKEALREQGADYQGLTTRPAIETFFKMEGLFNKMTHGLRPMILSNWGPMSHARIADIFDGEGSLTYTIGDGPAVTMGAHVEQLCRSLVAQLERGLSQKVPHVHEIITNSKEADVTLGTFVVRLLEEVKQSEVSLEGVDAVAPETGVSAPQEESVLVQKPVIERVRIESYEVPRLERNSTTLPALEVSKDVQAYVERQYIEKHPEWNSGNARLLYENSESTAFKRAVDLQLADIAIGLRKDTSVPLNTIEVRWDAFGDMTPREVLEQLEQHEELIEKQNASDILLDPKNAITIQK